VHPDLARRFLVRRSDDGTRTVWETGIKRRPRLLAPDRGLPGSIGLRTALALDDLDLAVDRSASGEGRHRGPVARQVRCARTLVDRILAGRPVARVPAEL